jgi:methylase of polypeptide subunit release factors
MRAANAKRLKTSADGELVRARIDDFLTRLKECLCRSPATSEPGRSNLAVLQRRLTLETLRHTVSASIGPSQRELLPRFRLFDDTFCRAPIAQSGVTSSANATRRGPRSIAAHEDAATGPTSGTVAAVNAARRDIAVNADDSDSDAAPAEPHELAPEALGELLESLLAISAAQLRGKLRFVPSQQRKQRGMFYTPRAVVRSVVTSALANAERAIATLPSVCDPSVGGGAFLLGAARALALAQPGGDGVETRRGVVQRLHGFDVEPLAIAVTEAALMLFCAGGEHELDCLQRQLQCADALLQRSAGPFDLVIGNPPWVAYAGRATQPLTEQRRRWLATEFEAFRGYPTLHACFVELAARLAPEGRIALLVPSPIADLSGYRPMRRTLTRTHRPSAELIEYGQDAFDGVVQPCFGLIADARVNAAASDATVRAAVGSDAAGSDAAGSDAAGSDAAGSDAAGSDAAGSDAAGSDAVSCKAVASDAPFSLIERSGLRIDAARLQVPAALSSLSALPRFSPECFREFGFQTTGQVTRTLLLRAEVAQPPHTYPLLEGRDVAEFRVGQPRLFLNPDRAVLKELRCRLREMDEYKCVEFVIRQTAKYTIAAVHNGLPFRNSLLAGFGDSQFSAAVLVGLLNSTLLRSVHLAGQRDARQKTFPQVKLAHLRALPAPPLNAALAAKLESMVNGARDSALDATERERLDALVYAWYGLDGGAAETVQRFFRERAG